MGRWDFEDERSTGTESAKGNDERDSPSRDDEQPRVERLSERGSLRGRDRDGTSREHALTLPSGSAREPVRDEGRVYHLRGSEVDLLERAVAASARLADSASARAATYSAVRRRSARAPG